MKRKNKEDEHKKAQAAMEFLMTYGWAILVVVIALGILAYTGVINVDMFLPQKFVVNPSSGMHGDDFTTDNINDITLRVKNFMNEDIIVSRIEVVTGLEGAKEKCTYSGEQTIAKDSYFNFPVNYDCNLEVGDKVKGTVEIEYRLGSGLTRKTTGSLTSYVHEAGEEVETCSDNTPYGQCSTTKPQYCDNGVLTDKCGTPTPVCGCNSGYVCQGDGTCCEVIDPDLVLLMHMDESSGPIIDSTCNQNDGTNNGATSTADGKIGRAYSFDGGVDSYISIPGSESLDITGPMTILMWVKPAVDTSTWTSGNWRYFIHQENEWKYEIGYYHDGGPIFKPFNEDEQASHFSAGVDLTADTWYNMAFVWDGTYRWIYVDVVGTSKDDFTGPLRSNGGEVTIGSGDGSTGFEGIIDEVYIYSRAFSDVDILAHFS